MSEPFRRRFFTRWGDLDSLGHMANTAYLDAAVDTRFAFFVERGYPTSELARLRIGPVVQRDEIEYYRELRLLDPYDVTLELGGLAPDASRMRLVNGFFRPDGKPVARVVSHGGWLDLERRKLVAPPPELRDLLAAIPHAGGFVELEPIRT